MRGHDEGLLAREDPNGDAAILDEVIVAPRNAYFPFPGLQVRARPGWMQLIAPAFTKGGFNEVSLAVMGDDEADRIIDATIAEYRALGIRFRWTVGHDSRPVDLPLRLAARGLDRAWAWGMARSTHAAWAPPPDGVRVEEVDEREIDVFTRVMAEGWAIDPAPLAFAHEWLFRDGARRHRLFLASKGGEPAGVASYVAFDRSAYLLGAVVLPAHRGAGVYGALVASRLRDAAARGIELATSLAREETSAPLLARMGFMQTCRIPVFHG